MTTSNLRTLAGIGSFGLLAGLAQAQLFVSGTVTGSFTSFGGATTVVNAAGSASDSLTGGSFGTSFFEIDPANSAGVTGLNTVQLADIFYSYVQPNPLNASFSYDLTWNITTVTKNGGPDLVAGTITATTTLTFNLVGGGDPATGSFTWSPASVSLNIVGLNNDTLDVTFSVDPLQNPFESPSGVTSGAFNLDATVSEGSAPAVPEPSTYAAFGALGLVALVARRKFKKVA